MLGQSRVSVHQKSVHLELAMTILTQPGALISQHDFPRGESVLTPCVHEWQEQASFKMLRLLFLSCSLKIEFWSNTCVVSFVQHQRRVDTDGS